MQDIIERLAAEGYIVDSIVADGKLHRFGPKRKSCWYICHQNFTRKTGEMFHVLVYGNWETGDKKEYCTLTQSLTAEDKSAVKKQIEEAKRKNEQQRRDDQERTRVEVENKWNALLPSGGSDYLTRKQIESFGARFSQGELYVPLRDIEGTLWSLQKIQPDGGKFFHPGGRVKSCFHYIGRPIENGNTVYICEGFATGGSVHLATGCPTVVVFNASNLPVVAAELRGKYKEATFIIAGDDDRFKEKNVGREKAEEAATKVFGKAVFPQFASLDGNPTDWNDLHCRESLQAVQAQLSEETVAVKKTYLTALGFKEKEYFYTSSHNQQIVPVTAFSKTDFLNLMPIEYWEVAYPGQGQAKVNWDEAISSLMKEARSKGIFESQNIRGAGVWNDTGRVVVNMGDHLIVNEKQIALGEIKSKFFYTLGTRLPGLHPNPLSSDEAGLVLSACEKFKWKNISHGHLLAGAMVVTRVCGALPIRPHIWITGERGSGKTTLFNRLIEPLIGHPVVFAGGNTSEAGIRQQVCANAIPVLFDEFENNGPQSAAAIQSILDLMRIAWSDTQASIIKGSASGVSTSYRARFAAIVTSIRQVSMNDADKSRFATLELDAHASDMGHWDKLEKELNKIDLEFGNRLFARTIKLLPVLFENFKQLKAALNRKSPGQRFGDQYGMLLAGTALLVQDEPITANHADVMVSIIDLTEEREDSAVIDHESALKRLLTWKYSYEVAMGRSELLIGDLIRAASHSGERETNALKLLGIKVQNSGVVIPSGDHAEFAKIYHGTRWANSWDAPLLRLAGTTKDRVRVNGPRQRSILVPLFHFDLNAKH